jgi:signal transduction histidine kinase
MAIHLCAEEVAGPLTEKQADLLFAARKDCERLQEIVNDLLDASRMQEGRIELELQPVDPERLLDGALEDFRTEAKARGVELRSEALPGAGAVLADPERIGMVLGNLIANAIRHTPAGGSVVLGVSPSGEQLRFEVSDTGTGIPREEQSLLFEKFYRLPGERGEGVGLGLYMSRRIVQAHGGAMGVESAPESGSTFWFTLPRASAAE